MASVKITDLTAYTDAASTDVLPIVDVSNNVTKKISISTLLKATPLGSAAAPAIAIDGDPNTGIYSLGADQLAVSTAGTGRLFIDSSGRVGIGTGSPGSQGGQKLTVSDGFIAVSTNFSSATSGELRFIGRPDGINYNWAGIRTISDVNMNQGVLAFFTSTNNTSGESSTERLRIDSSGRLLVGSSTARSLYGQTGVLQTEGTGYASSGVNIILNNASTAGPLLMLGKSRGSANGSNTIVQNGDTLGEIYFCGADGTDLDTPGAGIRAMIDGVPGSDDMPCRLEFSTTADGASSPTERMRISSTGIVTLQTPTNADGLNIGTQSKVCTDKIIFTTSAYYVVNGSAIGVILSTGSTAWAASSDERLKTDLEPITDGLEKVGALRAVTGKYISDEEGVRRSFLIAQDVQAVLPEAVSIGEDEDETLSLRYTEVVPLLVAALKEAKERIETLEAKVAALEAA